MIKLADVRKIAIRQQLRVRFSLSNGMECLVDEHGIARVPGLTEPPAFNLEDEFARAMQLKLEPVAAASGQPAHAPRSITRADLEKMAVPHQAGVAEDHDE